MGRLVIFLDDGGVMNDNVRRAAAWERLLGELLPPILGGRPEDWARANRAVMAQLAEEYYIPARGRVDLDFFAFQRRVQVAWMRGMCAGAGVPCPPEDEAVTLERQAADYITRRVQAAFPGAAAAIGELHAHGHILHTASGEDSEELAGYLEGMGVRGCFGRLYGPDLINTLKEGPAYYERVFADAGVVPREALVGGAMHDGFAADITLRYLADLPGVLAPQRY